MIAELDHTFKTTRRCAGLLRFAVALCGAIAVPALAGPAAYAQSTFSLPDPREFREGDGWDAFDADLTQRAKMPAYRSYVINHGRWAGRNVGLEEFLHPNPRVFTDLAGRTPPFPANHAGLWAAQDGRLYMASPVSKTWSPVAIGTRVTIDAATSFTINERMTPAQAEALSRRVLAAKSAPIPLASASSLQPRFIGRTTYCPDGHTFTLDASKPIGWRPGTVNMAMACAVVAGIPVRR